MSYDFKSIESKWQAYWEKVGLYKTPEHPKKRSDSGVPPQAGKFYLLEMFAYPSGDIHIGHFRNYTIGDIFWRYLKMKGYDLLHPFGWDAFGLPAEEAAIKNKLHPRDWTLKNINTSRNTLKKLSISYDWDREVITCNPDYYKWTQWIFLVLYKKGLAYRGEAPVNWCPGCKTVLANEEVVTGRCWRCDSEVTTRKLEQWFFRITDYAERLLKDIDRLTGWPENVKIMQKNWIGKSEGTEIKFPLFNSELRTPNSELRVFTTRPDTIYGVTFMVIAPEHPLLDQSRMNPPKKNCNGIPSEGLVIPEHKEAVAAYIKQALAKSEIDRTATGEKDGVFTGSYAVNPLSGDKVQLWVADYVLAAYGTGIVMGVPAHDQRDFLFAKKYNIPIKVVITPTGKTLSPETMNEAYVEPGVMTNSGPFNGIPSQEGITKITEYIREKKLGERKVYYRLKDWLISRQRYWGAPIPMINCPKCGWVPVPERDLPVLLPPDVKDFLPKGRSPLTDVPSFINTKCPRCSSGGAQRDPDTLVTFMCSSWYHLRYSDPKNDQEPFARDKVKQWLPIDLYIGGAEHACGHLIYFRFITKVLYDEGWLTFDEPAIRLFNHGMVLDEKGEVISKSKGNVVSPIGLMEKWGVDTARLAMAFFAPSDWEIRWSDKGLIGAQRFINRVWNLVTTSIEQRAKSVEESGSKPDALRSTLSRKMHQTIKRVTEDIDPKLEFNTAISAIMELVNEIQQVTSYKLQVTGNTVVKEAIRTVVLLLAPFIPHTAEEMWERLGEKPSIFNQPWPAYDPKALVAEETELVVQINGKVRGRITVETNTPEEVIKQKVLADEKIQSILAGKPPRKIIIVPGRLVNLVTSSKEVFS